jgi:hypothetical protein
LAATGQNLWIVLRFQEFLHVWQETRDMPSERPDHDEVSVEIGYLLAALVGPVLVMIVVEAAAWRLFGLTSAGWRVVGMTLIAVAVLAGGALALGVHRLLGGRTR